MDSGKHALGSRGRVPLLNYTFSVPGWDGQVAALQQLMTMLQHLYPNYASRVLVVNLPSYLAWFVRFVKGMLDEVTAAKIELIEGGVEGLRHYYATEGLPAYYRDLGG